LAGIADVSKIKAEVDSYIESLGGLDSTVEFLSGEIEKNNETLRENREMLASTATTVDDLNQYLYEGAIAQEDYDKAIESIGRKEAEKYGLDQE
jgi:hypothetical protein